MSCFDCALGHSMRRVETYMKRGGTRLFFPAAQGDYAISTIVELTTTKELKLRDLNGAEWFASPCRLPHTVFAGLA